MSLVPPGITSETKINLRVYEEIMIKRNILVLPCNISKRFIKDGARNRSLDYHSSERDDMEG